MVCRSVEVLPSCFLRSRLLQIPLGTDTAILGESLWIFGSRHWRRRRGCHYSCFVRWSANTVGFTYERQMKPMNGKCSRHLFAKYQLLEHSMQGVVRTDEASSLGWR